MLAQISFTGVGNRLEYMITFLPLYIEKKKNFLFVYGLISL